MKRRLAVIMSLALMAGVFAGCNSGDESSEITKGSEPSAVVTDSEQTTTEESITEESELSEETNESIEFNVPDFPYVEEEEKVTDGLIKEVSTNLDQTTTREYENGLLVKVTEEGGDQEAYQKITRNYVYENGKLLSIISTQENGDVNSTDYEYDGDLLTREVYTLADGSIKSDTLYTYENGWLVQESTSAQNPSGELVETLVKYDYDKEGNRVRELSCSRTEAYTSWLTLEYTYDDDGNLLTKVNGEYDPNTGEITAVFKVVYEYDAEGKETCASNYDDQDEFLSKSETTYDDKGNILQRTLVDADGTTTIVESWTYEYDSEGRILQSVVDSVNRTVTTTYTYE